MPVKGIKAVKANFRTKINDISERKSHAAVYAILSQGAAIAATLTPIDTSNLINSQFGPEIENKEGKITGEVGYTANYAAAVHEMSGKLKGKPRQHFGKTSEGVMFGGGTGAGNYWDPGAEPRFLYKGFEEIKPLIPDILKAIYDN